jgi:hypothetical protein
VRLLSRIRIVVTVTTLIGVASMTAAFADPITLFNTGVDNSNAPLAAGAPDPHYTILASPYGPMTPVVVDDSGYPFPPWVANDGDSKWIGRVSSGDSGVLAGDYLYRTTFNLTGLLPSTGMISGKWSTDNNGLDILINGISTGHTTGVADFGSLHTFAITSGFAAGVNTLDFVLHDGTPGAPGGKTGLRVDEIHGSASAVPEPCSLALLAMGGTPLLRLLRRRRTADVAS